MNEERMKLRRQKRAKRAVMVAGCVAFFAGSIIAGTYFGADVTMALWAVLLAFIVHEAIRL